MKSQRFQLVILLFTFMSSIILAQLVDATKPMVRDDLFQKLETKKNIEVLDSIVLTKPKYKSKRTYKYHSNNKLLSITNQRWKDTLWENIYREIYTYDSNWNISVVFNERWGILNKWQSNFRDVYTYNSTGNIASILTEQGSDTLWTNLIKKTFTYDSTGHMISSLRENWKYDHWENYNKHLNTYTDGKLTMSIMGEWKDSVWLLPKTYYTYNSNNLLISTISGRIATKANPNAPPRRIYVVVDSCYRRTYTYDINNNMVLSLHEEKDTTKWENVLKKIYTYNGNGSIIEKITQLWNNTEWETYSKTEYFYRTTTDIDKKNSPYFEYSLSQNYPNPFNPNTTIAYTLPKSGLVQLKVYDILGREVANLVNSEHAKGNYKVNFDASNLSSGIYFYKLQSGDFTKTKKFVLLK